MQKLLLLPIVALTSIPFERWIYFFFIEQVECPLNGFWFETNGNLKI